MMIFKDKGRLISLAGAVALAAASALAQGVAQPGAEEKTGLLRRLLDHLPGGGGLILGVVVVVLLAVGAFIFMSGRRRIGSEPNEDLYSEPTAMESSKFEQLLAETQGMYLRIQGGESKGYYRKIERLARIFLERIGVSGASQMSYEEIHSVLNSGTLSQKVSNSLLSIFERCRQGAEHEGEKVEFTAGDLIKELRLLVKQAAEETSSPRMPL